MIHYFIFMTEGITKSDIVLDLCKLGAHFFRLQPAELWILVVGWKCGTESSKVPFWGGSHF
jgi:hypothetical protein